MNSIVIFSPSIFQSYGHEFDYVTGLAGALSSLGTVSVHVVGFDGPSLSRLPAGITPHILKISSVVNAKGSTALQQIKWGLRRIGQSKNLIALALDVSNTLNARGVLFESFEYYSLARQIKRFKRPLRCIFHDTSFNTRQTSAPAALYKTAMARSAASIVEHCEHAFVHGKGMKANLVEGLRLDAQIAAQVVPIPYGAPQPSASGQIGRREARQALGIEATGAPLLLAFGTLRRDKAFPLLLTALSLAPNWRLLIAGPEGDMTFAEIESMARRFGVSEHVYCRNRFITQDEQPVFFGAADAIVGIYSPSIRHESGTSQLARTYLKPIIASGPPDLEEYVRKADVGWCVSEHSAESLARTLAEVEQVSDNRKRAMLGRIEECAAERSWPRVCDEVFRGWC
jgi:glycosyltransferase involved in cell wall biosynthesis